MLTSSVLNRGLYRARQLGSALRPNVRRRDRRQARTHLGETLYPLFRSMQPVDQRHCLDVYNLLRSQDCRDAEMLTAALIHDAGKGRLADARIGVLDRVAYTALEHAAPGLLARLASRWRGLSDLRRHPQRGLRLAREHGAPEGVITLLAAMDGAAKADERARVLMAADDAC